MGAPSSVSLACNGGGSQTCQAVGEPVLEREPLVHEAAVGASLLLGAGEEAASASEWSAPLGVSRQITGWRPSAKRKLHLRLLMLSGAATAMLCVATLLYHVNGGGTATATAGATGDAVRLSGAEPADSVRQQITGTTANSSASAAATSAAGADANGTVAAAANGTAPGAAATAAAALTNRTMAAAAAKSNSTSTQVKPQTADDAGVHKPVEEATPLAKSAAEASGSPANRTPRMSNASTAAAAFAGNSTKGSSSSSNSSRGISFAAKGSGANLTARPGDKGTSAVDEERNPTVGGEPTDANSSSDASSANTSSTDESSAGNFSASSNSSSSPVSGVDAGAAPSSSTSSMSSTSTTTTTTTTDLANCATFGEDCNPSKCCRDPGMQCYAKHDYFAACRKACSPGPDPLDVDDTAWSCKKIGQRTPGAKDPCAAIGEDCSSAQCCTDTGMQCYRKNGTWSTCLEYCPRDAGIKGWSCEELGARNSGRSYWVDQKCSQVGEDCTWSKCCTSPGMVCYEKNQWWASCKGYCKPGINRADPEEFRTNWSCKVLGFRAPQTVDESRQKVVLSAESPAPACAESGQSCAASRCCLAAGETKCAWTNSSGAICTSDCEIQRRATVIAKDGTPTLNVRGSHRRTPGCELLPRRGSLFCFMLIVAESYETGLVKAQYNTSSGIFACDDYSVFAVGNFSKGNTLDAVAVPREYVGVSKDGTAGNTMQFMRAWEAVFKDGRFRHHQWVVKVDADTVLIPHRLRRFLLPHVGESAYLVNCNRYPDSPDFPMMYGSLEVFSAEAMQIYKERGWHCAAELAWAAWGEDYFMTKCMDYLGVSRITALSLVGDENCMGAFCGDGWSAAYHPFKDSTAWMSCWDEASESQNLVSV